MATGLIVLFAAALLVAVVDGAVQRGELGGDYKVHMAVAGQWLQTGRLYADLQLAGPYPNDPLAVYSPDGVVNLYPPPAVLVFLPFLVLPPILWWLVPLATTAAVFIWWRPAWWSWPLLALPFATVPFASTIAYGNTVLWLLAVVALATLWPSAAVFMVLKPTLAPVALLFARQRSWWVALMGVGLLAVPFATYWPQYLVAAQNLRWPDVVSYMANAVPLLLTPILVRVAATRPHLSPGRVPLSVKVARVGILPRP